MICFPGHAIDIAPLAQVNGTWTPSVQVAPHPDTPNGYCWRHPGATRTRHEALRLAKRHLASLSPPGAPHPLARPVLIAPPKRQAAKPRR